MSMSAWFRRQSVQRKIFIPFFAITLLTSTLFTVYGFYQNNKAIVSEIDKRLLIAALTMPQLLPVDYFDRVQNPQSVGPEEHFFHTDKLNTFLQNVGATYLYALHMVDDRYYFIASADFATGFWVEYEQPAPNIYEVQKTWQPHISTTPDPEYGLLRSVVISHQDRSGRRFIIGADIHAYEVTALKRRAFINFVVMGLTSFVLATFFSYTASRTITRPLTRLSRFTRKLVEGDFASSIRLDTSLFPDGSESRAETAILAYDFDRMQRNLEQYIEQLKVTQSARELAESELRIAGQIQSTFLPAPFDPASASGHLQLNATMKTARQAGGDLYDYAMLDDRHLFFAIGDVSGKGMPAALFMSVVVALLRSVSKTGNDPATWLRRLNDDLAERNESCTFVTLFAGILDTITGQITFANGGHNPPRILQPGGRVVPLPVRKNFVVGAMDGVGFTTETTTLAPGETLFLYTDGVTEAMDLHDALFGEDRMDAVLAAVPPENLLHDMDLELRAFSQGREQADDITMLVITRKESP